jgi:hypothetical protein
VSTATTTMASTATTTKAATTTEHLPFKDNYEIKDHNFMSNSQTNLLADSLTNSNETKKIKTQT